MQILPRQEPYWAEALSGLIKTTGKAAGDIGGAYFEAKGKKALEKKEQEKKEMERVRGAQAMSGTGAMSYDQAYALMGTTPDIQKAVVQDLVDRGAFARMSGRGGGGQMPGMEAGGGLGSQTPISNLQGLASPMQQQIPYGAMTMSGMAQGQRMEDPGAFLAQRVMQGAAGGQQPVQAQPQIKPLSPERQQKQEVSTLVRNYDIDHGIDASPTNVSGMMGMGMSKKESEAALKKTYEYDDELLHKVAAAKGLNPVMSRMMELVEQDERSGGQKLRGPKTQTLLHSLEGYHGKGALGGLGGAIGGIAGFLLGGPPGAALGSGIGAGLGALGATATEGAIKSAATKETQEFEKLSAEFIKGAKGIFGSRITDQDLAAFMKMVPTLSNTNEGKIAILRNLQLLNKATLIEGQIRDEIKKQNGGSLPYNLKEMVDDISKPIMDRIAEQWKKDTEAIFEKLASKQEQAQPQNQSLTPRLPGSYSYNANEL
jgi:hypothetical protein